MSDPVQLLRDIKAAIDAGDKTKEVEFGERLDAFKKLAATQSGSPEVGQRLTELMQAFNDYVAMVDKEGGRRRRRSSRKTRKSRKQLKKRKTRKH